MRDALDPTPALWAALAATPPVHPWRARGPAQARAWQRQVRPLVERLLGFPARPGALAARRSRPLDHGDHAYARHEITVAPGMRLPVHVLTPTRAGRVRADARGRRPAVIALAGHGAGAREIIGCWEDGSVRRDPEGYQRDFARELVRLGFVVAVPELAGFGERQPRTDHLPPGHAPKACAQLATLAWHQGGSVVGLRVRDVRRTVDYLQTLAGIDPGRIGVMGISGGGMAALFSAAVEARLRAVVLSGYFSTFAGSILRVGHCWCNFVPGLARIGEMADLAALVAPRPLLVEAGLRDPIFPIAAVRAGLAQARQRYRVLQAEHALAEDLFDGEHRIHGVRAYRFLADTLDPLPVPPA